MTPQRPGLTVTADNGTTLVRFTGSQLSLDESTAIPLGEQLVALASAPGQGPLLVDLGNVEFLSSTMLGVFIHVHRSLRAAGRRFTVANVNPAVYEVFDVTRLTTFLDVRRDQPGPGGPGNP
jgi:anti-anti-sigma factor